MSVCQRAQGVLTRFFALGVFAAMCCMCRLAGQGQEPRYRARCEAADVGGFTSEGRHRRESAKLPPGGQNQGARQHFQEGTITGGHS